MPATSAKVVELIKANGGRILNGPNEIVEKPFDVHDLLNKIALAMFRSKDAP